MTEPGPEATGAELAEYYDTHRDVSGFDEFHPLTAPNVRGITLSIRFSPEEIAKVREAAEASGMKPTAYIRQAALVAANEVPTLDRQRLAQQIRALERDLDDLRRLAHPEKLAS